MKQTVLFRLTLIGASVLGLTACNQLTPEEQLAAELRERTVQELDEWAEVQRIWRSKEQEGQGCEGEVLRDPRLSEVVVGKHHIVMWVEDHVPDPKEGAVESRLYDSDGVLYSPLISDFYEAKFTIEGSLLCHAVLLPEGEYESCFRLIESPDGAIFEERLIPPGRSPDEANATDLSCLQLAITELGTSE